jgi:carboxypeptidase C (cathepsin A)
MRVVSCFVLLLCIVSMGFAAIDADIITSLPGYGVTPTPQYSGYLNVDKVNVRLLHYWFVTAANATADTPLVLWLNGGPGCSSLDGFLYEMGPFQFSGKSFDGIPQLIDNPNSWNQAAHMLYIEAPAFVGFSYSYTPSDANTNDNRTANDNFAALEVFFQGFPELAQQEFFIAGESYAGVYVPTLANAIRVNNAQGLSKINLKGFMVGNGCTGSAVGMCSPKGTKIGVDYMFGVNLYSRDTHDAVYAACSSSWDNPSGDCQAALTNMGNQIGDVNMYNILGPCIIGDRATKRFNNQTVKFSRTPTHVYNKIFTSGGPDECIDGIAAGQYLNNLVVRSAIHVLGPDRIPHWTVCTGALNYTSNIQALYPEPYLTLIDNYRVLVYNGDHDACVPIIDNEAWTESLGLSVEQPWHPWLVNQQVAGYVTKYNSNFAFASIKGAGHMVPQTRPVEALAMFTRYLAGQDL